MKAYKPERRRKMKNTLFVAGVALVLLIGCGSQPTPTPVPTATPIPIVASTPAPTATPIPTVASTPVPTPTVVPDFLASKAEDIIGALPIIVPEEPELQLEFTKEGTFSIGAVSGSYKGATFDAGKFWFEGTRLKFESTEGCLTAQGETIPCIGTYQVYVTRQGDKPALKFVAVEDQFADRKIVLNRRTCPLVKP